MVEIQAEKSDNHIFTSDEEKNEFPAQNRQPFLRNRYVIFSYLCLLALFGCAVFSDKVSMPDVRNYKWHHCGRKGIDTESANFTPLIRVAEIPKHHQLTSDTHHRRLVVMGDVHGMAHEMKKLLKKIGFDKHHDQLVMLGDFTTKGPDSLGVIDTAIENGAACVRGNHEDELVSLYSSAHDLSGGVYTYPAYASKHTHIFGEQPQPTKKPTQGPIRQLVAAVTAGSNAELPKQTGTNAIENENDDEISALDAEIETLDKTAESLSPFKREDSFNASFADEHRDMPVARSLKPHHIEYILKCPAMLKLGQVSKQHIEAVACHGGLVWTHHELEEQDPEMVMRVRGLLPPHYVIPTEEKTDVTWFDMWADDQKHRPKEQRYEVFYGHDASKGLQIHKYSKGLDSRCVKGDQLSAMVITVDKHGKFHQELVSTDCS